MLMMIRSPEEESVVTVASNLPLDALPEHCPPVHGLTVSTMSKGSEIGGAVVMPSLVAFRV